MKTLYLGKTLYHMMDGKEKKVISGGPGSKFRHCPLKLRTLSFLRGDGGGLHTKKRGKKRRWWSRVRLSMGVHLVFEDIILSSLPLNIIYLYTLQHYP